MRQIETTDFETSNVEFLMFWMMDPFDAVDGDANHSGGKLYFNLGDISEDILKDDRKIFDAISSWWCKSLGHNHPQIKAAIKKQMDK